MANTPETKRGIKLKKEQPDHGTFTSSHEASEKAFQSEVVTRLRRVESRLVRGMESLGATLTNNAGGISVTPPTLIADGYITITSLGTTVKNLLDAIGNEEGTYDISYNGTIKCQITTSNR